MTTADTSIDLHPRTLPECQHCQKLLARWQGSVILHARTTVELNVAKTENTELRSGLVSAIASIRALGGEVEQELQNLVESELCN